MRASASRLLVLALGACVPAAAADLELQAIALRFPVGEGRVLGKEQPLSFQEYDAVATVGLPWERPFGGAWNVTARMLASVGALRGPGETTVVASAIPALAFVHRDRGLAIEGGVGLAVLGRYDYPGQDYGGHAQFAIAFGVSMPVWRRFGIGYRFVHYSDAGAYGPQTIGADFHMLELVYYPRGAGAR